MREELNIYQLREMGFCVETDKGTRTGYFEAKVTKTGHTVVGWLSLVMVFFVLWVIS